MVRNAMKKGLPDDRLRLVVWSDRRGGPLRCSGGRAPRVWLTDGRSLYDTFGFEWTLLRLGGDPPDMAGFVRGAQTIGVSVSVVDVASDDARNLYEANLALVRPDQIVAWRGHVDEGAHEILRSVTGHTPAGTPGASKVKAESQLADFSSEDPVKSARSGSR
jgi:hypothetical protein